jgi:hypothetical protein
MAHALKKKEPPMHKAIFAAASVMLLANCAHAQSPSPAASAPSLSAAHVTTLVSVRTPPGVTRAQLEAGFRASVPTYQAIPGLIRKYFIVNADGFGGMYLWTDKAAAEAWYTLQWAAQCKARYGTECQVTYFDSPLQIDGQGAR